MLTERNLLVILTIMLSAQLFGQTSGNDTTFISKDTIDGTIQPIFIDYNRESKFYDKILTFKFQYFDDESYKYSTEYLTEQKLTLTKTKPIIPWTNWVTLKQYKGKYYAYHPCDFYSHFRQSINDTTFIDWTGEGPIANKIIEQKKIDNKTYEFKLTGIYDQDRKLTIHIIDFQKGIAIFEQTTDGTNTRYYLMIAAEKVNSVPIIVNYCPTRKQMELQFEKPDFEKLLKTK